MRPRRWSKRVRLTALVGATAAVLLCAGPATAAPDDDGLDLSLLPDLLTPPSSPSTTTTVPPTATPPTSTAPPTTAPPTTATTSTSVPAPTTGVATTTTSTTPDPAPDSTSTTTTVATSVGTSTTTLPATVPTTTSPGTSEPPTATTVPATTVPSAPVEPTVPVPPVNVTWQQAGGGGLLPRGGPGASTPVLGRVPAVTRYAAGDVDIILATIRQMESGGRYAIGPNRGGASGAYQFVRGTWNGYGGYPEAYLAPPQVQDERARKDVEAFLARFDGNAAMVPVMWYFPLAARDAAWMDRVPMPSAGNVLTVRQYQRRWLELFNEKRAAVTGERPEQAAVTVLEEMPVATPETTETTEAADTPVTSAPGDGEVSAETLAMAARSVPVGALAPHGAGSMRSIAFPVLGPVTYHNGWGDCRDGCARHHEGTDMIGVRMQPVLAAVDGVVTRVDLDNPGIAGAAVTIRDAEGWRYNYFHLNNDTPGSDDGQAAPAWQAPPRLEVGDPVRAGQIIGYMGDSGNSEFSVPHLHFEIRDPSGAARPSFWSLEAAKARQACSIGIGPWSFPEPPAPPADDADPAVAAAAAPQVEMTEVVPLFGSGTWLIDTEGRVTATGDAALIVPSKTMSCQPGPLVPYGADGAGWATTVDASIVDGTALATADDEYLTALGIHTRTGAADTAAADDADEPTAQAYLDPSTGELVLVPAGAVPAPRPLEEPEPVVAPRPLARFRQTAV